LDSKFKQFWTGATTPYRALQLILNEPKLMGLSLAPILATLISFSILIYALLAGAWSFAHASFLGVVSSYSGIVFILVSILLLGAITFFSLSLLTLMMNLLSSPFNDLLAENTERCLKLNDVPQWSAGRLIRVFLMDMKKSILTLLASIIFSLGLLIPIANLVFLIGISLLCTFIYVTYPLSRREKGIVDTLNWMRHHFFLSLGFGFSTTILLSIPVIDLFILPISVIGGTMLFVETLEKKERA
jgi:CysZ protein